MRCVFCKNDSSCSTSREHIIPESLGNTKQVLPAGVVCDKCNNYFSRKVEGPLLNSKAMRLLRFEQAVPSKKKRIPSGIALIDGKHPVTAHRTLNGQPKLTLDVPSDIFRNIEFSKGGTIAIKMFRELPYETIVSRFLAKVAVEAVAQQLIHQSGSADYLVEETGFDPIRDYARLGKPKQWSYHSRRIYDSNKRWPDEKGNSYQIVHEYDFLRTELGEVYFVLALFGLELTINLGGPDMDGYIEWLKKNDQVSPLYDRENAVPLHHRYQ